jgi:hypothetical protein
MPRVDPTLIDSITRERVTGKGGNMSAGPAAERPLTVLLSRPPRHADPALREKHLALSFLGRKAQSEILRSALQKLDDLLVSIE